MTKLRLSILLASGLCLVGGICAGAMSLASGAIDQAVAFAWPGLGAAIALALTAPGEPVK